MISIKRVETELELKGIQQLQRANLKHLISKEEADTQGFVTAEYSFDFFKAMHQASPAIIAKDNELVVGYALVAVKAIRHHHDLLADLFNAIDKIIYKGKLLSDSKYVVVGQLCVEKEYRSKGMVQQLYNQFKKSLSHEFDYCITDVAQDNPRSLKAHKSNGFKVIDTLVYGGEGWDIVLWDWRE
jgi:ribosomal protein S18 acetylase RimI-like enzyme